MMASCCFTTNTLCIFLIKYPFPLRKYCCGCFYIPHEYIGNVCVSLDFSYITWIHSKCVAGYTICIVLFISYVYYSYNLDTLEALHAFSISIDYVIFPGGFTIKSTQKVLAESFLMLITLMSCKFPHHFPNIFLLLGHLVP